MKRFTFILLIVLSFNACEKDPPIETGDILVFTKYQGFLEENVEVTLYDSYDAWFNYEFIETKMTNESGEAFFAELPAGKYYLEAEKTKSSLLSIYKFDSTEVVVNIQKNKILNLE